MRRAQRVGRDVVAEPVRGRVVGDREVLVAALARRPRPSPRAVAGRRRASCGSAGRRAGRSSSTGPAAPPPASRPRARRGPRAARAGSSRARASRRPPPRSRSAVVSPVASSRIPYSDTCSPRRTADSRSATLCALEPVKCCSTLPNWSGSTTFRSTFMPEWVTSRAPAVAGLRAPTRRAAARQRGDQRGGVGGGGDDVEVLDRVGPAAQRAGDLDAVGRRVRAQRVGDLVGDRDRAREHDARRRLPSRLVVVGQHLLEVLLGLGAEAAQLAHPAVLDRRAQRVERVDAELVVQALRPLGPEARAGA